MQMTQFKVSQIVTSGFGHKELLDLKVTQSQSTQKGMLSNKSVLLARKHS